MAITSDHIRACVDDYLARYPQDRDRLAPLTDALAGGFGLTDRSEMRGHVTAAVMLAREDGTVLHIDHNATGLRLVPGGHLEDEDKTLEDAAARELAEEAGIHADRFVIVELIDIDVHPIAANPDKSEGDHQHFDFRFAAKLLGHGDVTLQAEEVSGFAWSDLDPAKYEHASKRLAAALAA